MKVTMMAVFGFIGFAPYSASGDLRQVGRVSDASSELRTNFGLSADANASKFNENATTTTQLGLLLCHDLVLLYTLKMPSLI
jgi:hypothetical protein